MEPTAAPLQLREKLLCYGASTLSDIELLAVMISSGNKKNSCLQLACALLHDLGDLRTIMNASYQEFQHIPGLGVARYSQLQAAKEICRRSDATHLNRNTVLLSSEKSICFLKRAMRDLKHETIAAIFLDNQHRVISFESLFQGTVNSSNVYLRPIIQKVLHHNAAAIILAHNHPSGISDPSTDDIRVTKAIEHALSIIDVRLLDHIVVGDNEVYSIMAKEKWACV